MMNYLTTVFCMYLFKNLKWRLFIFVMTYDLLLLIRGACYCRFNAFSYKYMLKGCTLL